MTQGTLQADVVIVDAGPTGLTLANLLGGMGVSVILIERNRTTVQEPRAVSIDDESMHTMQAIDLHRDVERIVASGYGSHYFSPAGKKFVTVEPTSREYGFDKRNAFSQPDLEQVLRNGLSRFVNIRQFFGWEFDGLGQDETQAWGTIKNTQTGETRRVAGKYLVASDGGRSPIRIGLDIEMAGSTFTERWLIVDLHKTNNRFRHTEVFCDPARPCLALPGPDNIRRYEFMLFPGEDENAVTDHEFARKLLRRVGPDGDEEFRRIAVYTFHARMAKRWRIGRVFLAGDAAHLTPPFAGQGMNSGLRDAHNLAWKLAEAVTGAAPNGVLDSYEIERRAHAWEMIQLALRMGQVMMPHNHFKAWLTRSAFRLLAAYPPARDYFSQMKYKPKPRFKQGLIWADGKPEKATIVGRLIPQPVVEDVDRHRTLLDSVLRDCPVVIIFDEYPDQVLPAADLATFQAAGVQVVGLSPEWMNPARAGFPVYRDVSRFLTAGHIKAYLGTAMLLRRDRYVASVEPVASAGKLVERVSMLTGSSAEGVSRPNGARLTV